MTSAALKTKLCVVCGAEFVQFDSMVKWCSPKCGYKLSQAKVKLKRKKVFRRQKAEYYAEDKAHQRKLAIQWCNRYIVKRDGKTCISCGSNDTALKYSAGHYKTAGAFPEIMFHPDNIHSQCWWNCNANKSGNITEYRPRLLKKIGAERLAFLEGPHKPQNYTVDDYREIAQWYKYLYKQIEEKNDK